MQTDSQTAIAPPGLLHPVVGPTNVKYIKHCAYCGKFLKQHRWMLVGGFDYNQNKRPICWDCDAAYE